MQVYYTTRNIIMNSVGNDGESEPRTTKEFLNFCVRANMRVDSLVYVFGRYVFYCGGDNEGSLTTVIHNTAQNSPDDLLSDPADNHQGSDAVIWAKGKM